VRVTHTPRPRLLRFRLENGAFPKYFSKKNQSQPKNAQNGPK